MKILNLYAGIGGNRKLWDEVGDFDITAVEFNEDIAKIYQYFYPNDKVLVGDAHDYLLKNYKEFDFIWSSPPCPTHSSLVFSNEKRFYKKQKMNYPDMKLYQEIILLKSFAPKNTKWIIENVVSYYDYLIKPDIILGRHPFWSNFKIPFSNFEIENKISEIKASSSNFDVDLKDINISNKRQILRNMVNPRIGKYLFERSLEKPIKLNGLFDFSS